MKNYQNIYMPRRRRGQRVAHLSTDQLPQNLLLLPFCADGFVSSLCGENAKSLAGVAEGGGRERERGGMRVG